jgi:hypothetical protein
MSVRMVHACEGINAPHIHVDVHPDYPLTAEQGPHSNL